MFTNYKKSGPNAQQVRLIQTAARAAGLRVGSQDERYYLVLRQYRTPKGFAVTSCTQLDNRQIDDFLAICETLGWRHPGKPETYYRDKAAKSNNEDFASFAQQEAIGHLAADLGLFGGIGNQCLQHFIRRMTRDRAEDICQLNRREACNIIEALKAQLARADERTYENCQDIQSQYTEVVPNGKEAAPAPF